VQNISNMLNGLLLLSILLLSGANAAFSNNNSRFTSVETSNINTPKTKVVASFFPVYEFVSKVGGDKVDMSMLVPIGTEPHDSADSKYRINIYTSIQWRRHGRRVDKQN
jgi:zinc transport system substrate-binding protein